jgi:hypothetical protein
MVLVDGFFWGGSRVGMSGTRDVCRDVSCVSCGWTGGKISKKLHRQALRDAKRAELAQDKDAPVEVAAESDDDEDGTAAPRVLSVWKC